MRTAIAVTCALLAAAVAPGPHAHAQAGSRTLSFSEAEALALAGTPGIKIAGKGVEAARRGLKATRALRLPKVTVESNVLVWDESLVFSFAIPGMMLPPGMEPQSLVVRDKITSTTTLAAALPLSSQFALTHAIRAQEHALAAARVERSGARLDAAYRVADAYLTVLLAKAAAEIGATRIKQLTGELARAKVLQAGGVLQRVDVLRLESALAGAKADVINAEATMRLALGLLVLTAGLPPLTQLSVKDEFPETPAPPPMGIVAAVQAAERKRTELALTKVRAEQARAAARLENTKLYPNVLAVASLQLNRGMGSLQPAYAGFVGLTLQWNVWDWFGQYHTYKQASARADQASLAISQVRDGIRVEVGALTNRAHAAHKVLEVTRTQQKAAEEAFRIQTLRFKEGAATTTDLLDAEATLARARLAYSTARYSYLRSLANLAKATGQLPSKLIKTR